MRHNPVTIGQPELGAWLCGCAKRWVPRAAPAVSERLVGYFEMAGEAMRNSN